MESRKIDTRVLCLIPCSPEFLRDDCLPAIRNQTVSVSKLIVSPLPTGGTLDERVVASLNDALSQVSLGDFDFILRVDGDCVLSKTFLEEALKVDADIYGDSGCALVIKVPTFKEVMGGRFRFVDDAYMVLKYRLLGKCIVLGKLDYVHNPKNKPSLSGKAERFLYRGNVWYRLGWEPMHVVYRAVSWGKGDPLALLTVYGYLLAWMKRTAKFDIARLVFIYQIRKLFSHFDVS